MRIMGYVNKEHAHQSRSERKVMMPQCVFGSSFTDIFISQVLL